MSIILQLGLVIVCFILSFIYLLGPAEDHDDDGVGDERHHGQHRHDHPQQREHELHGPVRAAGVEGVARPQLETPGEIQALIQFNFVPLIFNGRFYG